MWLSSLNNQSQVVHCRVHAIAPGPRHAGGLLDFRFDAQLAALDDAIARVGPRDMPAALARLVRLGVAISAWTVGEVRSTNGAGSGCHGSPMPAR